MTVFTPQAVRRMIEKGSLKTCMLREWKDVDGDEMFMYFFPSRNIINFENGDGDFVEIIDFKDDYTEVDLDGGRTIPTTPDTVVYYR